MSGLMVPPPWVTTALGWVGLDWGTADTPLLCIMSDDWRQTAGELWNHKRAGDSAAEDVVTHNIGEGIYYFDLWWNERGGASEFLDKAIRRAENMSVALKAAATRTTVLQAATVTVLYAGVVAIAYEAAAVAAGAVDVAIGEAELAVEDATESIISRITNEGKRLMTNAAKEGSGGGTKGKPPSLGPILAAAGVVAGVLGVIKLMNEPDLQGGQAGPGSGGYTEGSGQEPT